MHHPLRILFASLALAVCLAAPAARAHEFVLDNVVDAYLRLEPSGAHLVVRVPLQLLGTISFPASAQRELDLPASGPAVRRALEAITQDLRIRENGVQLAPAQATGRLALPSDRSFDSYAEAVTSIGRPQPSGTVIYADQGYLDAHVVYPIVAPTSEFSIQSVMAPELGDSLRLRVHFAPPGRPELSYTLTRSLGAVALDPRWYQAAGLLLGAGVLHLLGSLDDLLLLLCLLAPLALAGARALVKPLFVLIVAHSATLVAASATGLWTTDWFPPPSPLPWWPLASCSWRSTTWSEARRGDAGWPPPWWVWRWGWRSPQA